MGIPGSVVILHRTLAPCSLSHPYGPVGPVGKGNGQLWAKLTARVNQLSRALEPRAISASPYNEQGEGSVVIFHVP